MSEEKLMPYQKKCPDGFIINKLLKKPKVKGGLIYSVLDQDNYLIHGDSFLPTWDETDHFHFVCKKCKSVADVLEVRFITNYSKTVKYALFFYLGCRKCGATGQRKIYLDRCPDACIFQHTFDHEGNFYTYGDTKEPTVITWKEKIATFLKFLKEKKGIKTIDEALNTLQSKL